jgi:hypothetical protein
VTAGQAATERQPCTFGFGGCDRTDTRPYAAGGRWFCPDHTPAKLAGQPEPDAARYCLAVCYCGTCPHRGKQPLAPITPNAIDLNAIKSGKRRSTPAAYREARRQAEKNA